MKGLIAGLAAGFGLAAALLLAAAGQAQGAEKGYRASAVPVSTCNADGSVARVDAFAPRAVDDIFISQPTRPSALFQSRPVLVAILDTGIDISHVALQGTVAAEINFSASISAVDVNGHGTHIAGLVCAPPSSGVASGGFAPNASLLNVKVADDYGFCDTETVARAIVWATDRGANVINVSLELKDHSASVEQAVAYAWENGAIIVAAAGNDGGSRPVYPAFYPQVMAVTASAGGRLAPLANYGDWVDFAAPGLQIYSTLPGNRYGHETGTSFSAAQVSGLAALLYGTVEDVNGDGRLNDEVRRAIEDTALENPALKTVHGEIDFFGALSSIARTHG